jgi:AraC family transcriptional regulator
MDEFESVGSSSVGGDATAASPVPLPDLLLQWRGAGAAQQLRVCRARRRNGLFVARWRNRYPHRPSLRDPARLTLLLVLKGEPAPSSAPSELAAPGQAAVVPPGATMTWAALAGVDYLAACFEPSSATLAELTVRRFADDHLLRRLGFVLADFVERDEQLGDAESAAWTTLLACHVCRHCACRAAGPSLPDSGDRVFDGGTAVLAYIEANLNEPLSVLRLADIAGTSRGKLIEWFKTSTGLSPHRYVLERRIAKARQLLAATCLPLPDVAYAVGFSSQSHMTAALRRAVGVTPSAYRAILQK